MNELKYIHYINFALNTNEILLELKTASLTCRGLFSPPAYTNISHTWGLMRNCLCTTGGVVFV